LPDQLIDIGINLGHDSFDSDRADVIRRADAVGVTHMVVTGSSLESTRAAIALVRSDPQRLRCTAGVHPHHAGDLNESALHELTTLAASSEVVAVGECGLDYFRNFSPHPDQERVFRSQLELAVDSRKPVFLHQRDAHAAFVGVLREYRPRLAGGVAHCFTGDEAELDAYLGLGLYIGITGWICDERRGLHLRDLVRRIPADRLLLESDAPYLLPRDLNPKPRSRRNEPRFLAHVLAAVATARDESPAAVASVTTRNALEFFGFPHTASEGARSAIA